MNGEQLRKKTRDGGIVYGTMLSVGTNPRWTQTISQFGLDYIILDTEHAPRSRAEVADYLTAFNYSGVVPIVRIPIPASGIAQTHHRKQDLEIIAFSDIHIGWGIVHS